MGTAELKVIELMELCNKSMEPGRNVKIMRLPESLYDQFVQEMFHLLDYRSGIICLHPKYMGVTLVRGL